MAEPREVSRVVPDTAALKALAHPVRVRMLGMLRLDGPATATRLAERLGLNSGATSYHLRQLALHGFIEEMPDRGSKRDRWWQARHESTSVPTAEQEGEALEAGLAFTQAALTWQVGQAQRAVERYTQLAPEWRAASVVSDITIPLTAAAAKALAERLHEVIAEAAASAPRLGTPLPNGVERYTIVLHGFPLPPIEEGEP